VKAARVPIPRIETRLSAAEWDKPQSVELLLALGDDMDKKDNNKVPPARARTRHCKSVLSSHCGVCVRHVCGTGFTQDGR
jgi:hypothetical protein